MFIIVHSKTSSHQNFKNRLHLQIWLFTSLASKTWWLHGCFAVATLLNDRRWSPFGHAWVLWRRREASVRPIRLLPMRTLCDITDITWNPPVLTVLLPHPASYKRQCMHSRRRGQPQEAPHRSGRGKRCGVSLSLECEVSTHLQIQNELLVDIEQIWDVGI